jgi:hypothetical protein
VGGIVEPIFIKDQRAGHCANLQQTVPVAGITGKAGNFQSDHESGMTHAHLGHEFLEACAIGSRSAGLPEIRVDHDNAVVMPAERERSLAKRVLTFGALGIFQYLTRRRLPDIQIGISFQVRGIHFLQVG